MKSPDILQQNHILPGDLHRYFLSNKIIVKKNTELFKQGDAPEGLYYILEGSIKISKVFQKEKERVLKIANTGDIIGLESFIDNYDHAATATVVEDSIVCFLSKNTLAEIIKQHPYVCYILLTKLYKYLFTSEKHIFLVSISKIDDYIAEIDPSTEVKPLIGNEPVKEQNDKKQTENFDKALIKKQKENYFQLKIKQLIS